MPLSPARPRRAAAHAPRWRLVATRLSPEQHQALKALARREQTEMAELLRRAVRELLDRAA